MGNTCLLYKGEASGGKGGRFDSPTQKSPLNTYPLKTPSHVLAHAIPHMVSMRNRILVSFFEIRKLIAAFKHGQCWRPQQETISNEIDEDLLCGTFLLGVRNLTCMPAVAWADSQKHSSRGQFILSLCHHGPSLWLYKQTLFFMLPWLQLTEFKVGKAPSHQMIFDYRQIACSCSQEAFCEN